MATRRVIDVESDKIDLTMKNKTKSTKFAIHSFDIKGQFDKDTTLNKRLLIWSIASLGISFTIIVIVLIFSKELPPQVPLLYGQTTGSAQIVPKFFLLAPAIGSMLITAINFFISLLVADKFLKTALVGSSLLATFFATVTILKIMFLVGNII